MTMQIRTFVDRDLPVLIDLLNTTQRGSYEFVPYNEEELRSWIQERGVKIFVAVENGEIRGSVAYNDGRWGEEIRWLAVSQNQNQKTIENELVKEAEKCVKGETVFAPVDAGSPEINDWIERGYVLEGGLNHMIAMLRGIRPLPTFPEGIILRSLRPEEEKEFVELVNAGFGWERMQTDMIQRWKIDYPPFNEEWIHVAEISGKLVSVVASRPDTDYNKTFNGKRGYLGPAVTLSEHRNKHLASALTCRAMDFLFEKGMDSVCLYTSEKNIPSVALLSKLGCEVGHNWKFMRKYFHPTRIP